ncbi:MAG: NADPH-dependent oxidoreductase [Bacteroidales bacterium]|nr:NADPH-dependent oxidoreductase [Bacteroidales bacterium]
MDDKYFITRRSVRRYSDKKVSRELLDSILREAMKAPTCGNMQLYSVIVTRDEEKKKELAALHFNQPAATGADVLLTICADYHRFTRWCEINGGDPAYDNFLSFTSAVTDAVILAQQIVTIAEMRGLGTCYLGTVTYNASKISELLHLPEMTFPIAAISIGYPAEEGEETERLDLSGVVYDEEYPELSDDMIRNIYKVKEEFAPNKKFVEENGKENLAQVFSDIRYPRSLNEPVTAALLEFMKKQRFL